MRTYTHRGSERLIALHSYGLRTFAVEVVAVNCESQGMNTELRDRLAHLQHELRQRITNVETDLRRLTSPLSADAPDRAVQLENDEVLQRIRESSQMELHQVDEALARLDSGWNATCASCGCVISRERLDAVPYASRCASCATDPQ